MRSYLACLLKSGSFGQDEKGILIHSFGDSYAHAHPTFKRKPGHELDKEGDVYSGKGANMASTGESMYGTNVGHLFSGHMPDYIASNPGKYGSYVDNLYSVLSGMNGGAGVHPEWIQGLKDQAGSLSRPGFMDFFTDHWQNKMESDALRNLPGGYKGDYHPEDNEKLPADKPTRDAAFMQNLINKIKGGIKGCCPP